MISHDYNGSANGNGHVIGDFSVQPELGVEPSKGSSGYTSVNVDTDKVRVENESILSKYVYDSAAVKVLPGGGYNVTPVSTEYEFKLSKKVPKTGLMLVGWGGNNGSTLTAALRANRDKVSFRTKTGVQEANYFGSVTQSSTLFLGVDDNGNDVYAPFNEVAPMLHPNDIVVGGWDISSANLAEAMERAQVLDWDLQRQLSKKLSAYKPLPSIYYPDFIAANQNTRADNVISGSDKWEHVEHIRRDIRNFKAHNDLDSVIVLWTANTERYADIVPGVNDTAENLLAAIKSSKSEVSPSTIFAVASILEDVPYINGSPQNTFVPGCVELAEKRGAFIGGDDFKSGQTKIKSVLTQYLVDAGIRPVSIASYNHLGNNDGYNLSAPKQFRSKEISKSSVVDDMIKANHLLYNDKLGSKIDHCIVIKYVPAVGDSKVAMDEYHSELMLGGHNTVSIHNVCEDSLLATPLIVDLVVMTEFLTRISYRRSGSESSEFEKLHSVLSFLSYWLKAPLTRVGAEPVNGLNKQRSALENLIRGLVGLAPVNDLKFEERL